MLLGTPAPEQPGPDLLAQWAEYCRALGYYGQPGQQLATGPPAQAPGQAPATISSRNRGDQKVLGV